MAGFCQAWWRLEVLISRGLVKRRSLKKKPVYQLLSAGAILARQIRGRWPKLSVLVRFVCCMSSFSLIEILLKRFWIEKKVLNFPIHFCVEWVSAVGLAWYLTKEAPYRRQVSCPILLVLANQRLHLPQCQTPGEKVTTPSLKVSSVTWLRIDPWFYRSQIWCSTHCAILRWSFCFDIYVGCLFSWWYNICQEKTFHNLL